MRPQAVFSFSTAVWLTQSTGEHHHVGAHQYAVQRLGRLLGAAIMVDQRTTTALDKIAHARHRAGPPTDVGDATSLKVERAILDTGAGGAGRNLGQLVGEVGCPRFGGGEAAGSTFRLPP